MADIARLPGVKKAALLFVILGDEATASLFPFLKNEEIQEITREIALLDKASADDTMQILEEFHSLSMAREYVLQGGVEYAKKILRQSLPPERAREILDRLTKYLDQGPGFAI